MPKTSRFSPVLMDLLNEHMPLIEGHRVSFDQHNAKVEIKNLPDGNIVLSDASFDKVVEASIRMTIRNLLDTANYMVELADTEPKEPKVPRDDKEATLRDSLHLDLDDGLDEMLEMGTSLHKLCVNLVVTEEGMEEDQEAQGSAAWDKIYEAILTTKD